MLNRKGYTGHVEFDDEAGIFHGKVLDLRDVVTFQGTSADELKQAFKESVDDYREFAKDETKSPTNPFRVDLCSAFRPSFTAELTLLPREKVKASTSGLPSGSSAPVRIGSED